MRLLELVATDSGRTTAVRFHAHLTVIGSLDQRDRQQFVDRLDRAAAALSSGTELHYRDRLGNRLVVTRRSGRRRVLAADQTSGQLHRIALPPPEELPLTTRIDAFTLRGAAGADLTVPQRLDLLVGWLGRARHRGRGGRPTVGVLDDPFTGLPDTTVRTLLDAVERLAHLIQIVYLTADPLVLAWASTRDSERALRYVPAGVLVG